MHVAPTILRRAAAVLTLASAVACGDKQAKTAAADSSLARDLALAGAPTANPTFEDTAVAPAPSQAGGEREESPAPQPRRASLPPLTRTPRPVHNAPPATTVTPQPVSESPAPAAAPAAAPTAAHASISAGTAFSLTTTSKVCTSSNMPGDKLAATLNDAVTGPNGGVIPAGSTVVLEVASANTGKNADDVQLTFRVRAIVVNDKAYDIAGDVQPEATLVKSKVQGTDPNADKKKVIGGAIAGAILGQVIGHDTKGTIIGAATGAAAGAAVAKAGERWEACLPQGAAMRLTLTRAMIL
jgi:hypothetical protein